MKVPFNEAETLDYITQEEDMELSWFDKQIGFQRSEISTTEALAQKYTKAVDILKPAMIFQPFKLNFILLASAGIFFIVLIGNVLLNPKSNDGFNPFIPFLIVFIIAGILGVIFDRKRNFKIVLSKDGITIKDFHYQWNRIYKTYIIKRRKGKGDLYYLVLAIDTGVTDRYEITNLMDLGPTDKRLSAYIEHYKNFA